MLDNIWWISTSTHKTTTLIRLRGTCTLILARLPTSYVTLWRLKEVGNAKKSLDCSSGIKRYASEQKGSIYPASAFTSQVLVVTMSPECKPMHICGTKTAAAVLSHPFVFAVFVLLFGVFWTGGTIRVLLWGHQTGTGGENDRQQYEQSGTSSLTRGQSPQESL